MSTATLDDRGVVAACSACGKSNRVPYEHLGETGICGACKAALPPTAVPVEVDSEAHFQSLIRASKVPVLVDFWAPWCGPCRMVAPEIAKVAASNAGRLFVAKVNTEALTSLGMRFNVQSIPMMAVFAGGREVARDVGARPASGIEEFVHRALAARAA